MLHRTVGQFGVAVGTSLAIESLAKIHPEQDKITHPIEPSTIGYVWINLRTICRNIYGSIDGGIRSMVGEIELYEAVQQEIDQVRSVFTSNFPKTKVAFYIPTYDRLHRTFPYAKTKDVSGKAALYAKMEVDVMKHFNVPDNGILVQGHFNVPTLGVTAILTHQPVDLITLKEIKNVYLLESNSGNLKGYEKWNSKFTGSGDMKRIPFLASTLQVCGDGGNLFSPQAKYKRDLIKCSIDSKWSPTTSYNSLVRDIAKRGYDDLAKYMKVAQVARYW